MFGAKKVEFTPYGKELFITKFLRTYFCVPDNLLHVSKTKH